MRHVLRVEDKKKKNKVGNENTHSLQKPLLGTGKLCSVCILPVRKNYLARAKVSGKVDSHPSYMHTH